MRGSTDGFTRLFQIRLRLIIRVSDVNTVCSKRHGISEARRGFGFRIFHQVEELLDGMCLRELDLVPNKKRLKVFLCGLLGVEA